MSPPAFLNDIRAQIDHFGHPMALPSVPLSERFDRFRAYVSDLYLATHESPSERGRG